MIPLDTGQGFTHRVIAVYAPWDVDDTSDTAAFWTEAAKFCLNATNSWTLLGDLNATVTQAERKSGGTDAHNHFNNFLRLSKGYDLWSNYPKCSCFIDWTCKPCQSTDGGSIIDHIVTSSGSFTDSEIHVADSHHDYVPMTDHRAIAGCLILKPPGQNSARCLHGVSNPVLNTPRIKFPNLKDKHLFQTYRDQTDAQIKLADLHNQTVTDHASFNTLYHNLTNIINKTAEEVFGRIKRKQRDSHKIISNPLIQQLIGQSRAIGGAIRLTSLLSY